VRVLLKFSHGLGDAVQLTAVLRHLKVYRPDWTVDVRLLRGKHSAAYGLCNQVYSDHGDQPHDSDYDHVYELGWYECHHAYRDSPSTKTAQCLRDVFDIDPHPDLMRYVIAPTPEARKLADDYLQSIAGDRPVLGLHYQGNTSSDRKDLPHDVARSICTVAQHYGLVPVILDWDGRSHLPDGSTIFCPGSDHPIWGGIGTGDAGVIAALIDRMRLFVGIDSGPLHVAAATSTPTVAVWTRHHPLNYCDLAANVTHLVPHDHEQYLHAAGCLDYFNANYRHHTYTTLGVEVPAFVEHLLSGKPVDQIANYHYLRQLRSTAYDANYYTEHRDAGLDYLGFGGWQQNYGRWLASSLNWTGKKVLDVGCACGAIVRGFGEAGIVTQGVDVNEHMIGLGRQKWPDMAGLLRVCDCVNLHLYGDGVWDGLHSAQVAEHWRPDLVPLILRELRRVTRPGGLFFCALDTTELFARQGRNMENEDPTHVCVKPMAWWHELLPQCGWRVVTQEHDAALRGDGSYLHSYDWDFFVAEAI